jgi:hypothetical protein
MITSNALKYFILICITVQPSAILSSTNTQKLSSYKNRTHRMPRTDMGSNDSCTTALDRKIDLN